MSLTSPDQRWKFISVGPKSSEHRAALYVQRAQDGKRWIVGWIERNGTVFWSGDSQRLFLRDEYAADDTKVRVFDITGSVPREIKGLDSRIRRAIFAHIPQNKTTQWLYYPQVCFADNDSSTVILVADAPLVPKRGSGSGKAFGLKLTVNLTTLEVVESAVQPSTPSSWHKLDAGPFSIFAPSGWEFHQLEGVDSFVGEFVGDGLTLKFDFGVYSNPLKKEKKPAYVVVHKSIGGFRAKVVCPRTPGHGITGVYFRDVGESNGLTLWGKDLTSKQQEFALKIFETLRFGGPVPRYLIPPPPQSKNAQ